MNDNNLSKKERVALEMLKLEWCGPYNSNLDCMKKDIETSFERADLFLQESERQIKGRDHE